MKLSKCCHQPVYRYFPDKDIYYCRGCNIKCDTIEQDEQNEEVGVEQLFNSFCLVGKITTLHADQIKEQLKEFENIILKERTEEIRKELNDMSYNGVLESNEKRRGYDIAITEFLEFLNKLD